jgi:hypothetical protein
MEKAWCGICQENHDILDVKPTLNLIEGCYGELYISVDVKVVCIKTDRYIAKGQVQLTYNCKCPNCGQLHGNDPFITKVLGEMSNEKAEKLVADKLKPVVLTPRKNRSASILYGNNGALYGAEMWLPVTCWSCGYDWKVYSKEVASLGFFKTEYEVK